MKAIMKGTLNINDNKFKMLFGCCLGSTYPIFIATLGRMKNEAKLVVASAEEDTIMVIEKVDDTHIKVNFENL